MSICILMFWWNTLILNFQVVLIHLWNDSLLNLNLCGKSSSSELWDFHRSFASFLEPLHLYGYISLVVIVQ